jgi:hypothetical protein
MMTCAVISEKLSSVTPDRRLPYQLRADFASRPARP